MRLLTDVMITVFCFTDNVKSSPAVDEQVFDTLDKMEVLQNQVCTLRSGNLYSPALYCLSDLPFFT